MTRNADENASDSGIDGVPPAPTRYPIWTWNELVLACALTARNGWHELDHNRAEVVELSQLLKRLEIHDASALGDRFRSPGSVRAKMMNLAHCHPSSSRKQSNRGSFDQEVVDAFLQREDEMFALAEQIRHSASEVSVRTEDGGSPLSDEPAVANLAQFKPSSREGLIAAVKAHYRVRNVDDERLVHGFVSTVQVDGFVVGRGTALRGLVLSRKARHWLVMPKVVRNGNATVPVQSVVGALTYEKYFFRGDAPTEMVALFSDAIGTAYVEYLESLGIRSIWRSGELWCGSPTAERDGLVATTL